MNLLEEGAYETAPTTNGRRIRKPLDNDFLYYAQASNTGRHMLNFSNRFVRFNQSHCLFIKNADFI